MFEPTAPYGALLLRLMLGTALLPHDPTPSAALDRPASHRKVRPA